MQTITDEYMRQMLAVTRNYTVVILKKRPEYQHPERDKIIWEHGRRNFALRAEGALVIVCPINDGTEVSGVGIFNRSLEETKKIMDEDPAIKAEVLVFEAHNCRGFPGSCLPE